LLRSVLGQFDDDDDEIYQAPFPLPFDLLYIFPSQHRVFDIEIHPGDKKRRPARGEERRHNPVQTPSTTPSTTRRTIAPSSAVCESESVCYELGKHILFVRIGGSAGCICSLQLLERRAFVQQRRQQQGRRADCYNRPTIGGARQRQRHWKKSASSSSVSRPSMLGDRSESCG
jgi:hypothetical protein